MFLAMRELAYAKLRYALIALIMFLLSLLVLFVSGLAQGLATDNAAGIMNMDADYFVLDEEAENQLTRSIVSETDQEAVASFSDKAEPIGIHMAQIEDGEDSLADIAFMSFENGSKWFPEVIEGDAPTAPGEIVADKSLKSEGFAVGSSVHDSASDMMFTLVGFSENQRYGHSPILHVSEEDWTEMGGAEFITSGLILESLTSDDAEQLASELDEGAVVSHSDVLSAFVLAAFFYVMTIQKLTQFGILKAIGARSKELAKAVFFQIVILSAVSVGLGIGATLVVGNLLPNGMPFHLDFELIGLLAALFFAVAVLGSLLSLVKVIKVDPLEAIGGGAE
ncbi:putative ABC transport system permease protein [Alkalihalobacillus xiaoxiensis]|uniref:Putative hemin transport system permease protein HrtB n=1 Tax=Shouchella xiaoxiensis TaxID=766895 RepID=A0ABS2SW24_9BACI|nr:ABC transporter permease [Shouchella xiaoxiensis]MBM7839699.1 putative ABC transport system permease protein [Shouchella xiaoxiensis]